MTNDQFSTGTDRTITVELPIDEYNVEVRIPTDSIERELQKHEGEEQFALHGPRRMCDLSKFVMVDAEPTDEKWKQLGEGCYD